MLKKHDIVLYEALIEKGLIAKEALEPFVKEVETSKSNLVEVLVKSGLFYEKDILAIIAEKFQLSYVNLKEITIEKNILDKVPVKIASYYKFMPVGIKDRVMTIAVPLPMDIKTQDEIRTQLGYSVETVLACQSDIADAFRHYYGVVAETLEKITSKTSKTEAHSADVSRDRVEDIEKLAGDASVIKLVNQIIVDAYHKRATDIHLEPYRQGVYLRYRVDGVLYDAKVPPEIKNFVNAIISRIKIMSNLNIVERRLPQDGRAVVKIQEEVLDLRISTLPTPYGESVVIRILPTQMLFSLPKLGLAKSDMDIFEKLIERPHGIIFVTGPTGSGKTTTLYTCLSKINTKERKIITLEDPIEYEMAGVTQIQVTPEIGLDFARGLRSILRHDPDVIMVGEVRDLETAEIAIRVALTGHLVFSTVHTNDAASGITRLVDIGVEPYLVASSVEAFIAQRLIRTICHHCKYEDKSAPVELKAIIAGDLGISIADVKIFRGKGCANCNHTGFFGRTAIYEILLTDEAIKDMIMKKMSSSSIKKAAISKGMRTLRQDGWHKVIDGITTPEEVMDTTSSESDTSSTKTEDVQYRFALDAAKQTSGPDKRVYGRLGNKVNVRYKLFNGDTALLLKRGLTQEQLSVTKNISAGGLLFVSDEILPVGVVLDLRVELAGGKEAVECLARVTRVEDTGRDKNYDIAVCFLDITSAQRKLLNEYITTESGR